MPALATTRDPLAAVEWFAQAVNALDQEASETRTALVKAMREAYGTHTLQEIGDAAGLSRQRVAQLLQKP